MKYKIVFCWTEEAETEVEAASLEEAVSNLELAFTSELEWNPVETYQSDYLPGSFAIVSINSDEDTIVFSQEEDINVS